MANHRWADPWKSAAVDWKNRAVEAEAKIAAVEKLADYLESLRVYTTVVTMIRAAARGE